MRLTVGSLFSGIGGMDLGLERAGFDVRWQVEIDEWCRRVLTKHWPGVPKYGDITELRGDELERVDLVAGGFPCQDISQAGQRAGIDGDRSGLWREFARLVRALRPRYVLVENVSGLLVRGMGTVLGDLAACGYDTWHDCLPAAAFGAPHLRDRVFIVAYSQEHGRQQGREMAPQDIRIFSRGCVERSSGWDIEPGVGRVVDGIPHRVDRLRGLGNAVVPQVAEHVGRRIMAMEATA